jgi:predicted HicB family RNase H-like nuclease
MREKTIRVRLSEKEHAKLKASAQKQGISMSEILRDYVKSLPESDNRDGG